MELKIPLSPFLDVACRESRGTFFFFFLGSPLPLSARGRAPFFPEGHRLRFFLAIREKPDELNPSFLSPEDRSLFAPFSLFFQLVGRAAASSFPSERGSVWVFLRGLHKPQVFFFFPNFSPFPFGIESRNSFFFLLPSPFF